MHNRPKLQFSMLRLLLLLLPLLPELLSFPTINQPSPKHNSYAHLWEKTIDQPPQIEETIQEVQKILAQDPSLPRLTRGEIEELYEKVTREEYARSLEAGDVGRANNMRALMLVLPFNTDNNTEENLQELYTRPPITKVIDAYTPPNPIKFVTPDPKLVPRMESVPVGNLAATTYKPSSPIRPAEPSPTTYHPSPPPQVAAHFKPSLSVDAMQLRPVTQLPLVYEYGAASELDQTLKPVQRFSSHYNAKNAEFLALSAQKRTKMTTTVKPVADVLEGLGIVAQKLENRRRYPDDDYHSAESAPRPVVSDYGAQSLAPKIRPEAYANFKPLNIGEEIRVKPEVEDYLTRFGIMGGRKHKELKKNTGELTGEGSEITPAKVPSGSKKTKKSAPGGGGSSELEKLLSNLQELERLNLNTKALKTTGTQKKLGTITLATTTATTTTARPLMTSALVTNGSPMLIEAKKPRRRIDPNLDINFAAMGNQQAQQGNEDGLQKLLTNLQELEKIRVSPENTLKTAAAAGLGATATQADATAVLRTLGLVNRFSGNGVQHQLQPLPQQKPLQQEISTPQSHQILKKSGQQNDVEQLQLVLKQLEALEQLRGTISSTSTTSTTTTTRPLLLPNNNNNNNNSNNRNNDLNQLRKLLNNDSALERLYEQVRGKQFTSTSTTPPPPPSPPTKKPTTTTKKPSGPSLKELEDLQKYFIELEKARARATTTTTTTPKTTTTTTTSKSVSQKPIISTQDLAERITANLAKSRKQSIENEQLQELMKRVQQLERLNNQKLANSVGTPTVTQSPSNLFPGFISRNVHQQPSVVTANDYRIPSNDFARLQQLYRQVQDAEQAAFGRMEISTAKTPSNIRRTQEFAQRLIDITNDTGYESNLQDVSPNDFVPLQKLLSKVKELERVKINADGLIVAQNPRPKIQAAATVAPQLLTAASIRTQSVQSMNGADVPLDSYQQVEEELLIKEPQQDFTPEYKVTTITPKDTLLQQPISTRLQPSSTEGWRDSILFNDNPNNPNPGENLEQYHQPSILERNSYLNMQPPLIQKTIIKEPPRFVATKKSHEVQKQTKPEVEDLPELERLLNSAPEWKNLGISLPKELPPQVMEPEDSISKSSSTVTTDSNQQQQLPEVRATTPVYTVTPEPLEIKQSLNNFSLSDNYPAEDNSRKQIVTNEVSSEIPVQKTTQDDGTADPELPLQKTAVFSLTTSKSLLPKEPRTTTSTTESTVPVPIFSATKIIEAAIRRAANKIGVSTENALDGLLRRSDDGEDQMQLDADTQSPDTTDLQGEFSELSYQLAMPETSVRRLDTDVEMGPIVQPQNDSQIVSTENPTSDDYLRDLGELQRLIVNLQELQRLNLNASSDLLRQADVKYLESFKMSASHNNTDGSESQKTRRQSATPSAATLSEVTEVSTTTATSEATTTTTTSEAPTRIYLGLKLGDVDPDDMDDADVTSSTTKAATEEPRNGSFADLENSFGPDPNAESTPPPPPKKNNGFYFLADWNSFLEVGDGDEQVVVRLNPKIGDPRLFLPVSVP